MALCSAALGFGLRKTPFICPRGLSVLSRWFAAGHMKRMSFVETLGEIKGKGKGMDQREFGQQAEQRRSLSKSIFKHFL